MNTNTNPLTALNDPSLLKTNGLINGEWVPGTDRFDVTDPATGRKLADVANLGAVETAAAIDAANLAGDRLRVRQRMVQAARAKWSRFRLSYPVSPSHPA